MQSLAARVLIVMLTVCVFVPSGDAQEQQPEILVAQLMGDAPAPPRSASQLAQVYSEAVDFLVSGMADTRGDARYQKQIALQYMAAHASRPDAEEERRQLSSVLSEVVTRPGLESQTRQWIALQLERMGKGESVEALAGCLTSSDDHLRDYARRALEKNSDPAAVTALARALRQSQDPAWRAALLNSLGQQQSASALPAIVPYLQTRDLTTSSAAAQALGAMGSQASREALVQALKEATPKLASVIGQILIKAAGELTPADPGQAGLIIQAVWDWAQQDTPGGAALRAAALNGLMTTRPASGLELVQALVHDEDPSRVDQAIRAARAAASIEATWVLTERLPDLEARTQIQVLGLIEERAALSSREHLALVTALLLRSPNESVQLAAIDALSRSDTSMAAKTLFEVAAGPRGAKQSRARAALSTLPGLAAQTTIRERCALGDSPSRALALEILGVRQDPGAKEMLLGYARAGDPVISRAALRALAPIVQGGDVTSLIEILEQSTEAGVRTEATKTLRSALARVDHSEVAAKLLVRHMRQAEKPEVQSALMTLLNALGGDLALQTVIGALGSADPGQADRALRTLCDWPDAAACPALMQVVRDSKRPLAHHVLAIRGLVRLLRMEGGPSNEEKTDMCLQILNHARQIEGRRLAISALGTLPTRASLDRLLTLAREGDLRQEAALAALGIAELTRRSDRDAARILAQQVLALDLSDDINQRARRITEGRRR